MRIALVLLAPENITPIFTEIMELYAAHLQDLGHEILMVANTLKKDRLNILFAYQYLPTESFPVITAQYRYIIFQLEQLSTEGGWYAQNGRSFEQMRPLFEKALQIWDFAPENIDYLNQRGLVSRLIPPGYHASLERCLPNLKQDIDVLFYGSPGARRFELLEKLDKVCTVMKCYMVYGSERDQLISRSKIVLNIHFSPVLPHTEQVRLSYLFNNQAFVISEHCIWQPYGNGLLSYAYDEIISAVLKWLKKPDSERQKHSQRSLESLKKVPLQQALVNAINDLSLIH